MKSIQVILIGLSVLATITGSIAFRSKLAYRLLAVVFFFLAVGFVLLPDLTSDIARAVGVGRGTDLLLYLTIFAGVHSCLLLYVRTRRIERKFTDLVRGLALAMPNVPELSGVAAGSSVEANRVTVTSVAGLTPPKGEVLTATSRAGAGLFVPEMSQKYNRLLWLAVLLLGALVFSPRLFRKFLGR